MQLKTIFLKPVDRPIEGVIKADDEKSLRIEMEEYVLTNEVEKRLNSFLDAYNNYENANGVWVSGFFGSGKSHLLKILAFLMENRIIEGVPALDFFLPKCSDEILRADLRKAASIPSKSILFNIDQKADIISKTQVDALLAVFVKVFDEMCGYYGKQGYIAQFERELDSRGIYEEFKATYQEISKISWIKGREQALLEGPNIANAYAKVSGTQKESAAGILDKYRSQYKMSIEDFADQVQAYIDKQAPNFRLNFFVDEVGQYVAENVKLMTNLQTIAESLATKCHGRAWIVVTAQEDMNTVVGEMGKQQSNDFSKIQARFANRMKLTSADVSEVIQKRLLTKNEEGIIKLSDVYHEQSNNFKTLFDFADGSLNYRNFQDREHFVHCYPFIPYQFSLFQSAIQNLSQHNAFEGKHSSVGERSMLGVFQQVAIQIGSHELGQLATFDLMFEGIRTTLKANIQRSIILAEQNLDNKFAICLVKTLFLVKYVKEFKSTIRNLCVLMFGMFEQDLPKLQKTVEEALSLLEQQSYIQRNGDLYEFLTDEEKDVELEIKNTDVDTPEVAGELDKLIFDQVIKNRKIRYDDNGQDYPFCRKIDDKLYGRESELVINVISPFHEHSDNDNILQMQSMGKLELLVAMPPDDRLVRDLLLYKRTEKYIRQNITTTAQEAVKRILEDKGFQNRERYAALQKNVHRLIGKSKLFVFGTKLDIGGEDPQLRITKGFYELLVRAYPNLRMLRGHTYTENDITNIIKHFGKQTLIFTDPLSEAEQEVLAAIQSNSRSGIRTTIKNLIEKFEKKPYGWYLAAILCITAKLCMRGKVEVKSDANILEENELDKALRNSHGYGNVVIEPQIDFTSSQVKRLKEFFEDFFDDPPTGTEAKALGKETGVAFHDLVNKLTPLASQSGHYLFLNILHPVIEKLKELTGKPYAWYLIELAKQEDSLLELKEKIVDPVRKFMGGAQKDIFESANKFIQVQEPNISYITGTEHQEITAVITDPDCFKGNKMQQVKLLVEALQKKVDDQLAQEISIATLSVTSLRDKLQGMAEYSVLSPELQNQITKPFDELINTVRNNKLIAVIRDSLRRFEEEGYQKLLERVVFLAQPKPDVPVPGGGDIKRKPPQPPQKPIVLCRNIKVSFDKALLDDESDVEKYLSSLRSAFLAKILEGNKIQI